jgi:hypothetical protein
VSTPRSRLASRVGGAAFALQFVALDVWARGAAYARNPVAVVGGAASVALWSLLHRSARVRAARAVIAFAASALVVVDAFVYRYYGVWLDDQVVASAAHGWADVRPIALRLLPGGLAATLALAAIEYAVLLHAPLPDVASPRRQRFVGLAGAVATLAVVALVPPRSLTPELRALHAVTFRERQTRAAGGSEIALPVLPSSRATVPSVMLVVTESVRASSYCSDHLGPCPFLSEVDALFPDRVPLRQLRSLASYTALSLAVLLTGRPLVSLRSLETQAITDAPTLFEYARATRVDGKPPWVAYWSGQAASVLPHDVRALVDSWVTLETLLGHGVEDEDDAVEEDMDGRLARRCVEELPREPRGPALIVLHLLGTHAPYYVDASRAPFQPTEKVITWGGLPHLANAYRDAIVAQDHALAGCLRAFVDHQRLAGAPWVILFTSDHGEAFGEHGAIHHGQNLYDEQTHVPGWVALSDGALETEERENLARHADAFVSHLDVVPTILDAMGVLGGLAFAPLRANLGGASMLAPVARRPPVAMTNCTTMFPCPLDTWGMLGDGDALVAQPWDGDWNCVDLVSLREHVTGAECDSLRGASRGFFSRLPNGRANGP